MNLDQAGKMTPNSTPFLDRVDPGLRRHIDLGRQAAKHVFQRDPSGDPSDEITNVAELVVSRAIRGALTPLGATDEDLFAAFMASAHAFAQHYGELYAAMHSEGRGNA